MTDKFIGLNGSDTNPGTEDSPFATINHALSQVSPGDTIYYLAGVYTNQGRDIEPKVSGTPDRPITIRNKPRNPVHITQSNFKSFFRWIRLYNGESHLIFQGLEISKYASPFDLDSKAIGNTHHILFEDLDIHDLGTKGVKGAGSKIRIRGGSHHLTFRRFDVYNTGGPGIAIGDNCHDILFEDCTSHDHNDGSGGNGDADGFNISHNGTPIPHDIKFKRCKSSNTSEDGFDAKGVGISYEECIGRDSGASVVKAWSKGGDEQGKYTYINGLFYGAGPSVFKAERLPDITMINCMIVVQSTHMNPGAARLGLRLKDSNQTWRGKLKTKNCIFIVRDSAGDGARPIVFEGDAGKHWDVEGENNVFYNEKNGIAYQIGNLKYSNHDVEAGRVPNEKNSRGKMPAFVDIDANDFHLLEFDTIAHHTGIDVSDETSIDLDGNPRPIGITDRGPYEIQADGGGVDPDPEPEPDPDPEPPIPKTNEIILEGKTTDGKKAKVTMKIEPLEES